MGHNPDQLAVTVGGASPPTESSEAAPEVNGGRGCYAVEDELVETEFTSDQPPADPGPGGISPERLDGFGLTDLPKWGNIDVDKVLPDPAIEEALRALGIVAIYRPRTGFLTPAGLKRLAYLSPVHVIRRQDALYCILGWDLVCEARAVLEYPRLIPACIHADMPFEQLKEYVIVERVAVVLRHQMSGRELNSLAKSYLKVIARYSSVFQRLGVDQWARIMGRTLRWMRYRMAKQ